MFFKIMGIFVASVVKFRLTSNETVTKRKLLTELPSLFRTRYHRKLLFLLSQKDSLITKRVAYIIIDLNFETIQSPVRVSEATPYQSSGVCSAIHRGIVLDSALHFEIEPM